MTLPSADTFHRTAKMFADSGEASTLADAGAMLATYVLQVHVGRVGSNRTLQAAVLSMVNAASRAFKGGVRVRIEDDCHLGTGWHHGEAMSAALTALGGTVVEDLGGDHPTVCVGEPAMNVQGRPILRAVASGWTAGIVEGPDAPISEIDTLPLAGVAAGGVAVAEAFECRRGRNVHAGRRSHGVSLWKPGEDWLSAEAVGPDDVTYAPAAWWLVGLGHLGQGYLWSIGMLGYTDPAAVRVLLQDDDVLTEANESTGLLLSPGTVVTGERRRKTRQLATLLDGRGFTTTITERRLRSGDGPRGDEPRLALIGVDNPTTRRTLSDATDFALIVDVGLGGGPRHYLDIQLHSFPASRRSDEVPGWQDAPARDATLTDQPAYLVAAKEDECGMVEIATIGGRRVRGRDRWSACDRRGATRTSRRAPSRGRERQPSRSDSGAFDRHWPACGRERGLDAPDVTVRPDQARPSSTAVRSAANMADTTLGDVVREGRTAKDIKLRELARRLDVTPSYVSDIENDRRVPSEEVLAKIAAELNLDYGDLVARAGRLGSDAERYMRQTPEATTLFRRISKERLTEDELRQLMDRVDELRGDHTDKPGDTT